MKTIKLWCTAAYWTLRERGSAFHLRYLKGKLRRRTAERDRFLKMAREDYLWALALRAELTRRLAEEDYSKVPRRVVCAAMLKDGRIITGARHFDKVMRAQMELTEGLKWWRSCSQGFIDQFGDFMTREEAWVVAMHQKQIFRQVSTPGCLYSENLY